jgi:hypothetical protein
MTAFKIDTSIKFGVARHFHPPFSISLPSPIRGGIFVAHRAITLPPAAVAFTTNAKCTLGRKCLNYDFFDDCDDHDWEKSH